MQRVFVSNNNLIIHSFDSTTSELLLQQSLAIRKCFHIEKQLRATWPEFWLLPPQAQPTATFPLRSLSPDVLKNVLENELHIK